MKKITILSIDGGGIRGILPGVILARLEALLQQKSGQPHARLSDYFDLMAGTSTGGILTCLYLVPDDAGRPRYTAQQAVDLYLEQGHLIFSNPFWRKVQSGWGLCKSKYSADALQRILHQYLGESRLSELLKPCLVTSYEITRRRSLFFNKVDTLKDARRDYRVRDIARATSAAPTYFEPALIQSVAGESLCCADGAVFANNPSMCAVVEARDIAFGRHLGRDDKPDYPDAGQMVLLSIGTGSQGKGYAYRDAKKWGVIGWLQPILDILMSASAETVHYQQELFFKPNGKPDKGIYVRLEPSVGQASEAIDCATPQNLQALRRAAEAFVAQHEAELNRVVDVLIANR